MLAPTILANIDISIPGSRRQSYPWLMKRAKHQLSAQKRNGDIARKLRRAEGIPEQPPPHHNNERKAQERMERENRRQAGSSHYRETLIRIGMDDVDTATLLIAGFSFLAMFVLPMMVIISS